MEITGNSKIRKIATNFWGVGFSGRRFFFLSIVPQSEKSFYIRLWYIDIRQFSLNLIKLIRQEYNLGHNAFFSVAFVISQLDESFLEWERIAFTFTDLKKIIDEQTPFPSSITDDIKYQKTNLQKNTFKVNLDKNMSLKELRIKADENPVLWIREKKELPNELHTIEKKDASGDIWYSLTNKRMLYHPDYHDNYHQPYKTSDLIYLCSMYEVKPKKEIALALGRTHSSIMAKVHTLRQSGEYEFFKALGKERELK